jgi:dihydroorotate dehydrogenase electron transfer subunit
MKMIKERFNNKKEEKPEAFPLFYSGNDMKKLHKGIIKTVTETAKNTVRITFEPAEPMEIKPGQFVSILCGGLTLRRPFSVSDFDGSVASVLFKIKGRGTNYLASLKPGDEIDFIGAMGNGFDIKDKRALVIGAGIGIAPVFYLHKFLKQSKLVGAFMNAEDVPDGIVPDVLITNDGSNLPAHQSVNLSAKAGSILDHLEGLIDDYNPEIIYACGPAVVLKAIGEAAQKHGIESQLALEKVMACGIGVCKGCVIKVKRDGGVKNLTICHDGPVFEGGEVVWE